MKLLREEILGGKVEFGSAEHSGTLLRVRLGARKEKPEAAPASVAA